MIDQGPFLLLGLLAAALLLRDWRSLKNLAAFFDAAEEVLDGAADGARVADDIALMSRSVLNPRRTRQMALLAARGALTAELRVPGAKAQAFAGRWQLGAAETRAARRDVLRRFVWELTRSSLVFGSMFGVWLLWRGAQHWREAEAERNWAILAGLGLGVRPAEGALTPTPSRGAG